MAAIELFLASFPQECVNSVLLLFMPLRVLFAGWTTVSNRATTPETRVYFIHHLPLLVFIVVVIMMDSSISTMSVFRETASLVPLAKR